MKNWGMEEDEIIEDKLVAGIIEHSQEKVEKHNFDGRKNLIEYDDVMNQHRKVVYQYRVNVLECGEQVYELVRDMIIDSIQDVFKNLVHGHNLDEKEVQGLMAFLSKMTHIPMDILNSQKFNIKNSTELEKDVINFVLEQYSLFRKSGDSEEITRAEKWIMLETIDQAWKQHMLNLDHLKEGISLRSWGQKNPLIEYKKEAFAMFADMMRQIKWEIVHHIFHLDVRQFDSSAIEKRRENDLEDIRLQGTASEEPGQVTMRREEPKIGRNDDCSCGSGKKFKKCCG